MEFSKQKVHDILEAVNQSLPADVPFISLFDGHAQQNGDITELLRGLCAVFPEEFHEVSIERLMNQAGLSSDDLPNFGESDPTTDEYWGLGETELDVFKSRVNPEDAECLDNVQEAISILHSEGHIDGDGNIAGAELRYVLCSTLGLNELVNLTELDWYLDSACGNLLANGYVTKMKIGRRVFYNFLESPFRLS